MLDVNECQSSDKVCGEDRNCQNKVGSYRCVCPSGFQFNKGSQRCQGNIHLLCNMSILSKNEVYFVYYCVHIVKHIVKRY